MHIPDGFLSLKVAISAIIISLIVLIIAFRKAKNTISDRHIPFFSVLAAAIFAGQMLNFTLIGVGGTSGHLIGAAMAAIIFGPFGAIIILTLVLVMQAFFFADGGVIALGANIFVMGIVASFTAIIIYRSLRKINDNIAIFLSGWASVVASSFICAIMLGFSGTIAMDKAILAMVPLHALIGVGEGAITLGILAFIKKTRPDILELKKV